ncbi:MAG TPA: CHAT domain-containing protein, partial [Burkholderiaceae bacterium]|nr:CHAT domain-containing protein [Burkholderiaceae bacterium]
SAHEADRRFVADKAGVYRRLAGWLCEDGRIDDAVAVLRRLEREKYAEFVADDSALRGPPDVSSAGAFLSQAEADLAERWDRLRASLRMEHAAIQERALGRAPARAATPNSFSTRQALDLQAAPKVTANLRAFIDGGVPPPAATAGVAPLPAPSAARPVREARDADGQRDAADASDTHGARPSAPPDTLVAWVVTTSNSMMEILQGGQRRQRVRLDVNPLLLDREVAQLMHALRAREPVEGLLQKLYTQVGAPIDAAATQAGAHVVQLHIDGALRYIPFAALHDGHTWLGERLAFEQALDATGPRQDGPIERVDALGVTRAIDGLPALPAVIDEICGIVQGPVHGLPEGRLCAVPSPTRTRALQGEAWLDDAFTWQRLQRLLTADPNARETRSALHIATHFELRPGVMTQSWLLLGDGARLRLEDIATLDLPHESLVTLSACETALGGDADGREVDGLGGLLIQRGAQAVIASLWPVEDRSTGQLMRGLYAHLDDPGVSPARALQLAQHDLREAAAAAGDSLHAHPFYWAGFTA